MKAGRKLDALIGKEIMCGEQCVDGLWKFPKCYGTLPFYSTNIADAWLVVEKLKDAGIEVWWDGGEWHCEIGFDEVHWEASTETAPLAICLAALKAVGW